jgi:hypothetical protein
VNDFDYWYLALFDDFAYQDLTLFDDFAYYERALVDDFAYRELALVDDAGNPVLCSEIFDSNLQVNPSHKKHI